MHNARIAAVVLAAGLSRRMGGVNKLLAEIEGAPVVTRVVDAMLASKAEPVLVVVGHEAAALRETLGRRDVRFVMNDAYEEGLGASLRAGVDALDEDVDGVLVMLGDMPWVRASHADALIAAFDTRGAHTICVPVHAHERGHPVLFAARHFPELRALSGDTGARALLARHASTVLEVSIDDDAVHKDIDTPEMLARATR